MFIFLIYPLNLCVTCVYTHTFTNNYDNDNVSYCVCMFLGNLNYSLFLKNGWGCYPLTPYSIHKHAVPVDFINSYMNMHPLPRPYHVLKMQGIITLCKHETN